jgi:hypothetical protein
MFSSCEVATFRNSTRSKIKSHSEKLSLDKWYRVRWGETFWLQLQVILTHKFPTSSFILEQHCNTATLQHEARHFAVVCLYTYACHWSLDRAHLVKIACTWSYSKSKYFARRKRQPRGFSTDFISKSRQVTLLMKLNYIYELCIHSINYYVHVQTHFILFKSDSHKVQYYFFLKQLGYRIFLNSK